MFQLRQSISPLCYVYLFPRSFLRCFNFPSSALFHRRGLTRNANAKISSSSVLEPVGTYRLKHTVPSKGKRGKKRKCSPEENVSTTTSQLAIPEGPEIIQHITIGLNSTLQSLQQKGSPTAVSTENHDRCAATYGIKQCVNIAVVFADNTYIAEIVQEKIAWLVLERNKSLTGATPILLVPLPKNSASSLGQALAIPQASIIGMAHGAPGTRDLFEYVRIHAPPIRTQHWMENLQAGIYFPGAIQKTSKASHGSEI